MVSTLDLLPQKINSAYHTPNKMHMKRLLHLKTASWVLFKIQELWKKCYKHKKIQTVTRLLTKE